MTSYFPLLPNMVDQYLPEEVLASTDLINYPNNHRKSSSKSSTVHAFFRATYKHETNQWKLISIDECTRGGFSRLSRNSMKLSNNQMVV